MRYKESDTLELKREYTAELKKEIIAFANSLGGTLYVGIDDSGKVIGLNDAQQIQLSITSMLREAIKPDLTFFTRVTIEEIEGKEIVAIFVQRGTNRPYYIAEKGLKPSGVYLRQGTSSVPASDSAIRQMIKDTDGEKYEEIRSLNQELTFESTAVEFKKRDLKFSHAQMKSLALINSDGLYTNLALLLSDQCLHTTKVAIFEGTDKSNFKDRREFSGSLLKQLVDLYSYLDLHNKTQATFSGLDRIDSRDYPLEAIREALLNALVHRDYSFSGSILINIYDDRIEFVSLGSLVAGISIQDTLVGVSQPRNEKLAAIFYRLRLIEAYGTGIIKIMQSYKNNSIKPQLIASDNAFALTLPNCHTINYAEHSTHEKIVQQYLAKNGSITRRQAEKLLDVKQTTAIKILNELEQQGKIKKNGNGKNTRYLQIS